MAAAARKRSQQRLVEARESSNHVSSRSTNLKGDGQQEVTSGARPVQTFGAVVRSLSNYSHLTLSGRVIYGPQIGAVLLRGRAQKKGTIAACRLDRSSFQRPTASKVCSIAKLKEGLRHKRAGKYETRILPPMRHVWQNAQSRER